MLERLEQAVLRGWGEVQMVMLLGWRAWNKCSVQAVVALELVWVLELV